MAAQTPAVVIVARHGTRFDAAHASWHLTTPTPYDPPLTYSGWNHCRALGVRIASLLYAREQAYNNAPPSEDTNTQPGEHPPRRKKKKHRVVIHTSPFLRCVQTSVGIASGLAEFEPVRETVSRLGVGKTRLPGHLYSASPRIRGVDASTSPSLAPIAEPKHDFAHDLARRSLEIRRHRRARLRVDPFLGEWLNPSYFEDITPPPPSAMMVTTAKAELLHNENIDVFAPTVSNKSSNNSLWTSAHSRTVSSRENSIDDVLSEGMDALAVPTSKRDRASSSSVSSGDTGANSRSPFRAGHVLHPFISTIPKPELAVYHPPVPAYALSGSDHIPRGYVAHARNECTNIDIHWDSSRDPVGWGDGGGYGEEWSTMQRRFRKGLNRMIEWYSTHHATEDPFDDGEKAERERAQLDDDYEEDLVVVLVTHAAGCNALIGALTSQPVLLDVGMASLTMAIKKDDAPPLVVPSPAGTPDAPHLASRRRHSVMSTDIGLSTIYDMKMVSSSDHLRPGTNNNRPLEPSAARDLLAQPSRGGSGAESVSDLSLPSRNSTSTSLGSIRRPSLGAIGSVSSAPDTRGPSPKFQPRPHLPASQTAADASFALPSPSYSPGLWTPVSARVTPQLTAEKPRDEIEPALLSPLSDVQAVPSSDTKSTLDVSPPTRHQPPPTATSHVAPAEPKPATAAAAVDADGKKHDSLLAETASETPPPPPPPPTPQAQTTTESRGARLWGASRAEDTVPRAALRDTKRRWTLMQEPHDPSPT